MGPLRRHLMLCVLALAASATHASEPLQVRIGYLAYIPATGPLLSNVIPEPADAGLRGAELAIVDSNSTGRFLKHNYSLETARADDSASLLSAAKALHQQGVRLFVLNAPAASVRQLSQALPDNSREGAVYLRWRLEAAPGAHLQSR